jgi:hypothetical protein
MPVEGLISAWPASMAQAAEQEKYPEQKRRLVALARELRGEAKAIAINVTSELLEHRAPALIEMPVKQGTAIESRTHATPVVGERRGASRPPWAVTGPQIPEICARLHLRPASSRSPCHLDQSAALHMLRCCPTRLPLLFQSR